MGLQQVALNVLNLWGQTLVLCSWLWWVLVLGLPKRRAARALRGPYGDGYTALH